MKNFIDWISVMCKPCHHLKLEIFEINLNMLRWTERKRYPLLFAYISFNMGWWKYFTSTMYTINNGNIANGIRIISNRAMHTNAFSAVNTWSSPVYRYVKNVTSDTFNNRIIVWEFVQREWEKNRKTFVYRLKTPFEFQTLEST